MHWSTFHNKIRSNLISRQKESFRDISIDKMLQMYYIEFTHHFIPRDHLCIKGMPINTTFNKWTIQCPIQHVTSHAGVSSDKMTEGRLERKRMTTAPHEQISSLRERENNGWIWLKNKWQENRPTSYMASALCFFKTRIILCDGPEKLLYLSCSGLMYVGTLSMMLGSPCKLRSKPKLCCRWTYIQSHLWSCILDQHWR